MISRYFLIVIVFLLPLGSGCRHKEESRSATPVDPTPSIRLITHYDKDGNLEPLLVTDWVNLLLLKQGAKSLEDEVKRGRWIVIVYTIYSPQDITVARDSPRFATSLKGKCGVAVRPTVDFEDVADWLPNPKAIEPGVATPLWILLHDGKVITSRRGMLTDSEILSLADVK